MQRIHVRDAQTELSRLVDAAVHGETVLIVGDDEQAVQLVPVTPGKQTRHAGSARGLIRLEPDFDAPLPDFDDYA